MRRYLSFSAVNNFGSHACLLLCSFFLRSVWVTCVFATLFILPSLSLGHMRVCYSVHFSFTQFGSHACLLLCSFFLRSVWVTCVFATLFILPSLSLGHMRVCYSVHSSFAQFKKICDKNSVLQGMLKLAK